MQEFKQKFDDAKLIVTSEDDGECQLEVSMITTDTKQEYSAVVWLDDEQRKELIAYLQSLELPKKGQK